LREAKKVIPLFAPIPLTENHTTPALEAAAAAHAASESHEPTIPVDVLERGMATIQRVDDARAERERIAKVDRDAIRWRVAMSRARRWQTSAARVAMDVESAGSKQIGESHEDSRFAQASASREEATRRASGSLSVSALPQVSLHPLV
jgi:hypothetical protein